jgi:hypothetical protein
MSDATELADRIEAAPSLRTGRAPPVTQSSMSLMDAKGAVTR